MPASPPVFTSSHRTPLAFATWLTRHHLISMIFAGFITLVVGWAAGIGRTGAELVGYVAPLLAAGVVATRPTIREDVREGAVVFGLLTTAALVANFAADSVIAPAGYFVALCLASLYERRGTLGLALVLILGHEAVFGTVIPAGRAIDGLPQWATAGLFGLAFIVAAAVLTIPWGANTSARHLLRRQRSLLDEQLAVSEILVALDAEGRATSISDHGLMVLGHRREDVIGADVIDLVVTPEHRQAAREAFARFLASGTQLAPPACYEFEHAVIAKGGERRVFLWRVTTSLDDGQVVGTVASGIDITEVRRAQRQLQRERRDLAHLQKLAQAVARETDARESVVHGIQALVDADIAGFLEPTPAGDELVLTRCTALAMVGARISLHGAPSGSAIAFSTAEPFFASDGVDHPLINQEVRRKTGATSFLYQPVMCDGAPAGVLVVGWTERLDELGDRKGNLIALAAEEAASALQRLAAMRRWEDAALTDALTGIPNRRAFDTLIEESRKRALADGQPLALALMDLNGFKALNDTQGHAAGDRVLKESASLWTQELRPTDAIARLGGDEFAVLLPNCGTEYTEAVAGRLRGALIHEAGCGVGIAVWDGEESVSAFLHRTDRALYADKAAGATRRLVEPERLAAVERTGYLNPGANPELDELARAVTTLLGVPVSLISLLDDTYQHYTAQCGVEKIGIHEPKIAWSESICQHPTATGRALIIRDVADHPLVAPDVAEGGVLGAYAGIPMIDRNGQVLGTTCAIDTEPRDWTRDEIGTLRSVAARATEVLSQGRAQDPASGVSPRR